MTKIYYVILLITGFLFSCAEQSSNNLDISEPEKSIEYVNSDNLVSRDDSDGGSGGGFSLPPGFTPPPSLTLPPDFTPPGDFTLPPGVTLPPDITPPPDLTLPPGITLPPDITPPPDLTLPPGLVPPADQTAPPITTQPPVTTPPANTPVTPAPTIGSVMVSLVELNDLHAHLTMHNDFNQAGALVKRGGLARMATAIQNIRSDNPNTIVMNIGDTYHGGVEAFYTEGNAIVEPVNALGIDVGVPGNWDFAYGPAVTRLRYTNDSVTINPGGQTILQPNFPNIAANVTNRFPAPRAGESFLPPTFTKTVSGVKIGFIGITSDIVPLMHRLLSIGYSFLDGEAAHIDVITQHANNLRNNQGAHVVVLMSELGIHKDISIANQLPSGLVDVIFSAHTHELVVNPIVSNSGTLVVEAGNDTKLGRMDITINNGLIVNTQWQIIPIDSMLPEDANMRSIVDRVRAPFLASGVNMNPVGGSSFIVAQPLTQPIDTVIGMTPVLLDRRHVLENSFNNIMTEVMQKTAGSQAAFTLGFRFDAVNPSQGMFFEDNSVASGEVSIEDAFRFFPAPMEIASADITGADLILLVEDSLTRSFSTNAFRQWGGWFNGFSGLDLNLNLAAPDGSRVDSIMLAGSGTPIASNDVISMAGCQRPFELGGATLCSHTGFTNIGAVVNPATGNSWTAIDLFIDALSNNRLSSSFNKNITDINNTKFWPDVEFIQPLYGVQ